MGFSNRCARVGWPQVLKLPGLHLGRGVVGHVFDVTAAFQHQRTQAFFGELLGSPAPADASADHDGIVRAGFYRVDVEKWHFIRVSFVY